MLNLFCSFGLTILSTLSRLKSNSGLVISVLIVLETRALGLAESSRMAEKIINI